MRNCVNVWCPDELINDYCQAPTGNRDFQHYIKRWFTFFHHLQIVSVAAFTTNDHLDATEDTLKLVVQGGDLAELSPDLVERRLAQASIKVCHSKQFSDIFSLHLLLRILLFIKRIRNSNKPPYKHTLVAAEPAVPSGNKLVRKASDKWGREL